MSVFIDHWLPLSLTNSLTHCRSVDLIDVTLTGVDVNSKLVDVVTVADVDAEDRVGKSLLQIWMLMFCHKAKILITRFGEDFEVQARFEAGVWLVFCC